eukprot:5816327-Amphidinium_carterae.1
MHLATITNVTRKSLDRVCIEEAMVEPNLPNKLHNFRILRRSMAGHLTLDGLAGHCKANLNSRNACFQIDLAQHGTDAAEDHGMPTIIIASLLLHALSASRAS